VISAEGGEERDWETEGGVFYVEKGKVGRGQVFDRIFPGDGLGRLLSYY
jgi:hypothetical protein